MLDLTWNIEIDKFSLFQIIISETNRKAPYDTFVVHTYNTLKHLTH